MIVLSCLVWDDPLFILEPDLSNFFMFMWRSGMMVLGMTSRDCIYSFWNLNGKSEGLGNLLLLSKEKGFGGKMLFERNQNRLPLCELKEATTC